MAVDRLWPKAHLKTSLFTPSVGQNKSTINYSEATRVRHFRVLYDRKSSLQPSFWGSLLKKIELTRLFLPEAWTQNVGHRVALTPWGKPRKYPLTPAGFCSDGARQTPRRTTICYGMLQACFRHASGTHMNVQPSDDHTELRDTSQNSTGFPGFQYLVVHHSSPDSLLQIFVTIVVMR